MSNNELLDSYIQKYTPYLLLEGNEDDERDTANHQAILKEGIKDLENLIAAEPDNFWGAYWTLGKIHQALDDQENAYKCFLESHNKLKINGQINSIALRELALACLHTKRLSDALYYCKMATEFDLEDYTLWANLAIANLLNSNIEESERWANKTLEKIPDDMVSKNVLNYIKEIRAGVRSVPTDFRALLLEGNQC